MQLKLQTSVLFRNAIKTSCLQKSCVHLRKFIVLSNVAALVVSLSQRQNAKSCDGSEEERARSLVQKEKTEHKCSLNAVKSALRTMSTIISPRMSNPIISNPKMSKKM